MTVEKQETYALSQLMSPSKNNKHMQKANKLQEIGNSPFSRDNRCQKQIKPHHPSFNDHQFITTLRSEE